MRRLRPNPSLKWSQTLDISRTRLERATMGQNQQMRILLITLPLILLASCAASGTQMQAECEARLQKFPEIFQCTYEAVASRNPSILQDARAKLYLLRGEQLALQVLGGKISNLDAKVAWQQLYVELKSARDQEVLATMNATSRSLEAARVPPAPSAQTLVVNPRTTINCTSTRLGANVYTTCN